MPINGLLVALPTVAALGNIHTSAAILTAALIGVASLSILHQRSDHIRFTPPAFIIPLAGLCIALRTSYLNATVSAIYYLAVLIALVLTIAVSRSRQSAFASLLDGIGLLLITAIAFRYLGIGGAGQQAVTGNFVTGGERVLFTLTGSLTSAPALAAAYLVAAVLLMQQCSGYHRAFRLCASAAALFVLVQGDRRSAFLAALVILMLAQFGPAFFRRLAPWSVGILLTLPFTLKLTGQLSQLNFRSDFLLRFQRSGEENASSINDRFQIWNRALEFYQDRVDWFHQAVGFGSSGHVLSGASVSYRSFFGDTVGRNAKSPHSSAIMALLDGGWIVAAAFVITAVSLAWVMSRRLSTTDLASLAMLAALTTVGATESNLAPGYPQPVAWTFTALCMIGFSRDHSDSPGKPRRAISSRHTPKDQRNIFPSRG